MFPFSSQLLLNVLETITAYCPKCRHMLSIICDIMLLIFSNGDVMTVIKKANSHVIFLGSLSHVRRRKTFAFEDVFTCGTLIETESNG